ncbi:MAG: 50S ribosomal protein L29 [Verrucomicrobiota bacterium]
MCSMKVADIRAMSEIELRTKAQELRQERLNLRIQQQTGQLEKPSRLYEIRKSIARIETILSEKRLESIAASEQQMEKTA